MSTEKGISLLEIIFSIGVTVLIISGTVSLMVKSTGTKTNAFSRKRAYEVAEMVTEDLLNRNKNNGDDFWRLNIISGNIEDYNYSVGFSRVNTGNCSNPPAPANCAEAVITVTWGLDNQTLTVKRFFSKY